MVAVEAQRRCRPARLDVRLGPSRLTGPGGERRAALPLAAHLDRTLAEAECRLVEDPGRVPDPEPQSRPGCLVAGDAQAHVAGRLDLVGVGEILQAVRRQSGVAAPQLRVADRLDFGAAESLDAVGRDEGRHVLAPRRGGFAERALQPQALPLRLRLPAEEQTGERTRYGHSGRGSGRVHRVYGRALLFCGRFSRSNGFGSLVRRSIP